jgi:hypothetical protein
VLDPQNGWIHLASRSLELPAAPGELRIVRAHPNPFNPAVTVEFTTPRTMQVSLTVHDVSGRQIVSLSDRMFTAGRHTVEWDGRDEAGNSVAAGVYLLHLESQEGVQSRKVMLVK